jgi:hypothetical protein
LNTRKNEESEDTRHFKERKTERARGDVSNGV